MRNAKCNASAALRASFRHLHACACDSHDAMSAARGPEPGDPWDDDDDYDFCAL
jgi:hypothetical protein